MKIILILVGSLSLLLSTLAQASARNDVPDCYSSTGLDSLRQPGSGRELTIIIDQTIPMPEGIQQTSWNQVNRFVAAGDKVRLYTFSAFVPGQYIQLRFAGELNQALPEKLRSSVGMQSLRSLDQCLNKQQAYFRRTVGEVFVQSLREASEDIPRSEILHSLREIGSDLAASEAEDRVILLLSDMLENSEFGTFYSNNQVRNLQPDRELKRIADRSLFADLLGAKVYVAGAGLLTASGSHGYRSGKTMESLQSFWRGYFDESNATLVGFGMPSLNVDLR